MVTQIRNVDGLGVIRCTLVHKLRNIGPEFWPTQRASIRLGIVTHLVLVHKTVCWSNDDDDDDDDDGDDDDDFMMMTVIMIIELIMILMTTNIGICRRLEDRTFPETVSVTTLTITLSIEISFGGGVPYLKTIQEYSV